MQNSTDAITPQRLESEGKTAYHNGDFSKAASSFMAAQAGYTAKEDHLMAAEMANNRSVALLQSGQPQAALKALAGTISVFEDAQDYQRQAMALGNRACVLEALDQLEAAIADYEKSAALLKDLGADGLRLDVLKTLSSLQLKSGRSLEALANMQAGMDGLAKPNSKQRLLKRLLSLPGRLMGR